MTFELMQIKVKLDIVFVCAHAWPYFNCLQLKKVNWYKVVSCLFESYLWKIYW